MNVLFLEIDQDREWAVASLGPACVGAFLRSHGHHADILRVPPDQRADELLCRVRERAPDLIGVSLTSRQWLRARELIAQLRQRIDTPVIAGGLHATFAPETVLAADGFDYVCMGEGELAALELIEALETDPNLPIEGLRNIISAKSAKQVIGTLPRPELHPPFEPIDALPNMARDLLDERYGVVHLATQRGCPYPCTYCAARKFSDLYGSYANYGRRRSVEGVLNELEEIRAGAPLNYVIFLDDTFTINHAWLDEFCDAYGREFSVPFSLHARVETVNARVLDQLATAGCAHITYGVESGSERVRREIMQRHAPNEQFIEVFAATRAAGIMATANYIIGTPGETRADIEQTIELHLKLQPTDFGYFVFYPYPGTPLFNLCEEQGYLPDDYYDLPANHRSSILTFPSLSSADIDEYYARFTEIRTREHIARYEANSGATGSALEQQSRALARQIAHSAELG